jgi:hypothetical protein
MATSFDYAYATRMCPTCAGPIKLYITEEGVQFAACMRCQFETLDRWSESLDKVRQLVTLDRREYAKAHATRRGVKKGAAE